MTRTFCGNKLTGSSIAPIAWRVCSRDHLDPALGTAYARSSMQPMNYTLHEALHRPLQPQSTPDCSTSDPGWLVTSAATGLIGSSNSPISGRACLRHQLDCASGNAYAHSSMQPIGFCKVLSGQRQFILQQRIPFVCKLCVFLCFSPEF